MAKSQTAKMAKKARTTRSSQPKPSAQKQADRMPTGKRSSLDLAADILAKSGCPLQAKLIAEKVIAAGWQTKGKTPHATLYAAMIREIEKKGRESRFKKVGRGQFAFNTQSKASQ